MKELISFIQKRLVTLAVTGFFGLCVLGALALSVDWSLHKKAPDQPIAFSHRLHLERVGLKCADCHLFADKSRQATVPALSICMNCHAKAAVERPEVKKLLAFQERREGIPWIKVHELPWHVYFTHKRHVKARVDCSVCHGEVRAMEKVRRVRTLEMGWCVNCHRSRKAPTDCLTCHK